jgi:hypothetical protein
VPTDFTVIVEEVNDTKGRYKVVLDEAKGVIAFCNDGPEIFGLICGFCPKGIISVQHPFSVITGPPIYPGSQEFQAKCREGEKLRKKYE